ncbi:MAG: thiamine phosphate synthase [Bacteroidales bacterium]|nr:thiamine phosphate synthase [Bacteroidales bacterium]
MLQFIIENNDKYTLAEQAQMALEGGCGWLVLRMPDAKDEDVREAANEIIPLCKENSAMLSIENHAEVVKELGVHGIYLRDYPQSAMAVRELLGPEAIIGVEVGIASAAIALLPADIDYIVFGPKTSRERISENIEALRNAKFELPIVAEGNFHLDEIHKLKEIGVNGIAVGSAIGASHDPVHRTEEYINKLVG